MLNLPEGKCRRGLPLSTDCVAECAELLGEYGVRLAEHPQVFAFDFADAAKLTPYYTRIIPAMKDYYETAHYIFVHGWIPAVRTEEGYAYDPNWRGAGREAWRKARWYHGIDAAQQCDTGKTVLCGHWHCSYGHAIFEGKGSEFGHDADFSPYYGPGVVALDACTAYSGRVNLLILRDREL